MLVMVIVATPLALSLGETRPGSGKNEAAATSFIRLHEPKVGNAALQIAIASYQQAENPEVQVDLVGAIHIGDARYYQGLNKLFAGYDAVLFEMIGGRDGISTANVRKNQSPVGALQNMMKSVLQLEYQLEGVEYGKDNFFHADMSAKEFFKEMKERKEGLLKLVYRAAEAKEEMKKADPGGAHEITFPQLLRVLMSPNGNGELKYLFAQRLLLAEGLIGAIEDGGETVLVAGRNRVAMARLDEIIAEGKKKIAVFYGAAHLQGMERLLLDEGGYKKTRHRWVTAWDIDRGKKTRPGRAAHRNQPAASAPASPKEKAPAPTRSQGPE